MRNLWSPFVLLVVLVFSVPLALGEDAPKTEGLKITSPVFENNRTLPLRYTCDGKILILP